MYLDSEPECVRVGKVPIPSIKECLLIAKFVTTSLREFSPCLAELFALVRPTIAPTSCCFGVFII